MNLRATNLRQSTPLKLALARTRDLIKFFQKVQRSRIDLNQTIRVEDTFSLVPLEKARGAVACVAGHAALRYAPANLVLNTAEGQVMNSQSRCLYRTIILANQLLASGEVFTAHLLSAANGSDRYQRHEAISRLRRHERNLKQAIRAKARRRSRSA